MEYLYKGDRVDPNNSAYFLDVQIYGSEIKTML